VRVVAGSNPATPTNQIPNKISYLALILIDVPITDFSQLWGILWGLRSKIGIRRRIASFERRYRLPARLGTDVGVSCEHPMANMACQLPDRLLTDH
jgi:hypothetical protein